MESTETSRGKKKFIAAGFMFTFHAFSADSTKKFWRCVIRSCQCRLHAVCKRRHRKPTRVPHRQFHSSPIYNGKRLKRELDVVHPSIWKFIDGLRRVQKGRDVTYGQYVRGEPGPVKRPDDILADQRLLTTVNDYNNRDIIEYLRGIAHNFLME